MKQDELLKLKKSLESALNIVATEIRNAVPVDAECDSNGYCKPPSPDARWNAVETVVWDNWDSVIPDGDFTAAQLRAKLKNEKISQRSHASFSALLSRWAANGYLKVLPGTGPTPNTYSKKIKGAVASEMKKAKCDEV